MFSCDSNPDDSPDDPPSGGTLNVDTAIASVVDGQSATIRISAKDAGGSAVSVSASSAKNMVSLSGPVKSGDRYELTVTGKGGVYGDDTLTITSDSGESKTVTVRVTDPLALHCDGLLIRFVNNFEWLTDDHGSGQSPDITVFTPKVPDGYSFLGHYVAQGHYYDGGAAATDSPTWRTLAVKEINGSGALAKPTGFTQIWTSTGWDWGDIRVYKPIAPNNYYAMGFLAVKAGDPEPDPATTNIRCVHKDYVAEAAVGGEIWAQKIVFPFTQVFFAFMAAPINNAVLKQENELFLETGCPVAWLPAVPGTSVPQVSDGFVVMKVKSPVMLDRNDTTYVPKLTSLNDTQGARFPVYYKRTVAVPWYLVTDNLVSVVNKLEYTPIYHIDRDSYFVLGEFRHNQGSLNYTLKLTNKTGVTNTTTKTEWESRGIEVSGSVGFKFASASFKITRELGFATTVGTSEFTEKDVSDTLTIPPGKAGGLFEKYSDLQVVRRNNVSGDWEDNVAGTMTVAESYIVPDEYPD